MAIELVNEQPQEALNYKNIFMDKLVVDQSRVVLATDTPRYTVHITYRKFAIDSSNKTHYDLSSKIIHIEDYFPEALAKAAIGDMDLLNALGAIQIAIANIIAEKHGLQTEVV